MDRVGTLRQLKARGWWKEPPPRGRSGAPLIPRIPMERGVLDLFPPVPDGAEPLAHRENAVGRPLCLLLRMRRPHQTSCQIAGGMRREGEPQESRCDERDGRGDEKMGAKVRNTGRTWRGPRPGRGCRNGQQTSSCRRAGRRSRTSCVTSARSVTSVASIRHRSGHSAAATWFGPMCCLLLQRISTW